MIITKCLFFILATLLTVSSNAQQEISKSIGKWDSQVTIKDMNGRPVNSQYSDVDGFPYVLNGFKVGAIELKNGRKFVDVPLRLNIVSHEINFISPNKEEGVIGGDFVKDVSFSDTTEGVIKHYLFRAGLPAIDNHKLQEFCEVLADGKIALVKAVSKKIDTRKNELSGEIAKDFVLYEDYYTYEKNEMKRFKKDKETLLILFANQQKKMEAFIKTNKGSFKNEPYLISLFNYYNQL